MRRLIRESNPPSGQLASPVPQYWNPSTEAFEDVLGEHGAPRAILYGPNGQPIGTQTNPLEVRVRGMGVNRFNRIGPMAAGTVELIADLRSAVQIMSIQLTSKTPLAAIRINSYKDDGSLVPVNYATFGSPAGLDHRIVNVYQFGHSWFEVTRWEDQNAEYVMWTRPGAPLLFPRGVQIYVANNASAEYNVHCHVYVRLL